MYLRAERRCKGTGGVKSKTNRTFLSLTVLSQRL